MRQMPLALAACLVLLAVAAPGATAQKKTDSTPPTVKVAADLNGRCDGDAVRLRVRVTDSAATRAVVRLGDKRVKTSTSKRFTVKLRLGSGAYAIKTVVRDRAGNRFTHTLNVVPC